MRRSASQTAQHPSDEMYRRLVESLPVGVLLADPSGINVQVNEEAARMTGYSVEELMAGVWMVHPDDTEALALLNRALTDGTAGSNYETRLIRKDGSVFWVSISWRPVTNEQGDITGVCTVIVDISDRKDAEEELAKVDERYRVLSENASDMIWEMGLDGRFTHVSGSVRHLGYEPEECIGHSLLEFLAPDEQALFIERLSNDTRSPGPIRYEVRALKNDGSDVWMEVVVDLITENGKKTGFHGVSRDVTSRKKAEEELRQVNDRYRQLAENTSDLIWTLDLDGTITYITPSVRQLGYEPKDWIGHHPFEFIFPEEHEPFTERMSPETISNLRPEAHPLHIRCKDGSSAWLEVVRNVARVDGVPVGVQGMARVITERKAAEEALAESEARYKSIVENSTDLILLTTPDGKIVYASPASRDINGYEPEELVAGNLWVIHPDDTERMTAAFLLARQGKSRSNVDYRIITKSGETRWALHSWSPIMDGDRVRLVVSVIKDITERIRTREALRESEEKYKSIVEHSSDLIMLCRPDGVWTYASPACRDILGYEPEELVGAIPSLSLPEDSEWLMPIFRLAMTGESGSNLEYRVTTKNGKIRWVWHAWSPIFVGERLHAILSVIRDVTEAKQTEEAIRAAHAELEHAYELQQQFLNNVTHEVRTPLTAVKGYAEMLMDGMAGPISEEQSALLGKVLSSSEHLLDVVNGVLEIARLKSGRIALSQKVCDPRKVVDKAVSVVLPQAQQKGLTINVQSDPAGCPGLYDEQKLVIILTNLLSNAVKFTEAGSIDVIITCRVQGAEVVVSDTGMGISSANLMGIFDEFSQLDYPRKHKPSGFGVGLAIVATMVETIGASLIVSSKKGVGTAFTLSVPVLEG